MDKTWMEVEMDESITLLRQTLEELNKTPSEDMTYERVEKLKNIYKTLYYIHCLREKK